MWLKSHLAHRKQLVEVNRLITDNLYMTNIILLTGKWNMEYCNSNSLAPFVFLYIIYLPINTQEPYVVLYADDTNLLITDKDESALPHKIKNIMKENWFHKNNIIIKVDETIAMSLHTIQNRLPVRPQISLKNMDVAY